MKPHLFLLGITLAPFLKAEPIPIEQGFQNPPLAARPHTWWHWMNGNISREGITADLEAMADIGLGGANLFNVSCDIPEGPIDYLSPEWLGLVHHAASEAKRLKLELGIKNCAGWSTSGGPWIKPEESMQTLYWSEVEVSGGRKLTQQIPVPKIITNEPGDDLADLQSSYRDIALLAFPAGADKQIDRWQTKTIRASARAGLQPALSKKDAEGKDQRPAVDPEKVIDLSTMMTADGTLSWDAPEGEWTILRLGHGSTGVVNHPAPKSGTGLEADKMNRRSIDSHWKFGIQPILDHLGPLAGKTLTNIVIDSYEAKHHAWTPDMRAEFKQRRGYDMGPFLVSLTGRCVDDIPRTERFFDDFRRTIGDLVTANYYGYMAELCHKHGLKLAIEPYRGPFESMTVAMRADIPTGEFFSDLGYGVPFLKLCSSAANLRGLPITAAEAYTGIDGWRSHPGNLKYASDRAWTEGINRLVFHRYAHQPWLDLVPGMTMGPYGIHFERTNTWWKPGKAWIESITRSQFLLQRGTTVADVLSFAGEAVPNTSPRFDDLKIVGYDFDLCGTDVFYQLTVKDGQIVVPSGRQYRVLLMGPTTQPYLSLRAAKKVRELVAAGATVIGQKPTHAPSLSGFPEAETELRRIADELWSPLGATTVPGKAIDFKNDGYIAAIRNLGIQPDLILPENSASLYWIHRQSETEDIYFISNQSRNAQQATLGFRVNGRMPELWDALDSSTRPAAGWHVKGDHTFVPLTFQADGSAFVVFRKEGKPAADPVIAVTSSPPPETRKLIIHRANLINGGEIKTNEEISGQLSQKVTSDGLLGSMTEVTGRNSDPFTRYSLDIDYEWSGIRTRAVFEAHELINVPARHLLEKSWPTQLVQDPQHGTALLAWRNADYTVKRASGKSEVFSVANVPSPILLNGPWEVRFPPNHGVPESLKMGKLTGWSDYGEFAIRKFSGTATLTTTFDFNSPLPAAHEEIWLDLGDVHVMAEVQLNGEPLGTLWAAPYRVEVGSKLRPGKNTLAVSVTNLWVNRLIADAGQPDGGKFFDTGALAEWPEWIKDGKLPEKSQRLTFTTWKHWKPESLPPPSGLRGPVTLRFAKRVALND
jgi:hypothetical protein